MINRKSLALATLALLAALILGGCSLSPSASSTSKIPDGGVWKSLNAGKTWTQTVALATASGKPLNIASVVIRQMVFDPQDYNAIYLATESNGIFYTYDAGASWRQMPQLNISRIRAIAVDPKTKCTLYAIMESRLYKSADCGRFWQSAYEHQKAGGYLVKLAISPTDSQMIFMADNEGNILRSRNASASWETVQRIKGGQALDLLIDAKDSKIIYVGTKSNGIYKSVDAGNSWTDLNESLKNYSGSKNYIKLILDPATTDGLILISQYGMLRSQDGGQSWTAVALLPAPKAAAIYTVAVNPKNSNEIYYATATSLVKSIDGGQTWSSAKLPAARVVSEIQINPDEPLIVYLGTQAPIK